MISISLAIKIILFVFALHFFAKAFKLKKILMAMRIVGFVFAINILIQACVVIDTAYHTVSSWKIAEKH